MAMPEIDQKYLDELESMGFPIARAIRALYHSGNRNLEAAINWILEHEKDPDIDQIPLIPREIDIEYEDQISEEENFKVQQRSEYAQERKLGEEKILTRGEKERSKADTNKEEHERKRLLTLIKAKKDEEERERARIRQQLQEDKRERIRAAKDLMEAKGVLEENQRKRMLESRKADQEEEKRARERIHQRIEEDKAERRRKLGLLREDRGTPVPTVPPMKEKTQPPECVVRAEQLSDCLRNLKKNHKDNSARVRIAFLTLLKIVGNIVKKPDDERFRRIRLSNPVFQARVGNLREGIEFLLLCGFEKHDAEGYLVMPKAKVDTSVLNAAGMEINSAISNPFFGLLSK